MNRRRIIEVAAFAGLGVVAVFGWVHKPSSMDSTAKTPYVANASSQTGAFPTGSAPNAGSPTQDAQSPASTDPSAYQTAYQNSNQPMIAQPQATAQNASDPQQFQETNQAQYPPNSPYAQNVQYQQGQAQYQSPNGPCTTQGVSSNDAYYRDPYYSSSRPVLVRTISSGDTAYYASAPQPAPVYVSHTYTERRQYRRGRSTGKSVAIVAGSAGVGAAIGALAGGGRGAGIGALAGGGAGFIYDRLTHKTHSGL